MSDLIPVNAEQLVVDFLLADVAVKAMVAQDVYSELPASHGWPAVRVHQFYDVEVTRSVLWLMRFSLQVDVWGGPKVTTRTIADTIRFACVHRLPGVHARGVVTFAETRGLDTTPDPVQPPATGKSRPRCRFDLEAWMHPVPVSV